MDADDDDGIERAFSVCGYCFTQIPEGGHGYISGGVIASSEGYGPEEFRGRGVETARADGSLIGCIVSEESELAEEGWNFAIFVCSRRCGRAADAFLAIALPVELRDIPDELIPRAGHPPAGRKWWKPF